MRHAVNIAHLSDTHLGFKQYPATTAAGRNQREADFSRAFRQVVDDICAKDPALVVHSGDVFDAPHVSTRHQKMLQAALQQLSRRPDGSIRVVVVISGNHDQPLDPREPCALELDTPLPGVFIVTSNYRAIDLTDLALEGKIDPALEDVVVHCLPHDQLKVVDFDEVTPVEGKTNILLSHCVVGGSSLYRRCKGREFALPIDVATRGWTYGALGHFHKQGPVAVGGYSESTSPLWYAGSTENNGLSDVFSNHDSRGYLWVRVEPDAALPTITPVSLPIRAMFRLPDIDATGLDDAGISAKMRANIRAAAISGAVVVQPITGVRRDTWALIDRGPIEAAAAEALWYEAVPKFAEAGADDGAEPNSDMLADLGVVLEQVAGEVLADDPQAESVRALARKLLGAALEEPPTEVDDTQADDSVPETAAGDPADAAPAA